MDPMMSEDETHPSSSKTPGNAEVDMDERELSEEISDSSNVNVHSSESIVNQGTSNLDSMNASTSTSTSSYFKFGDTVDGYRRFDDDDDEPTPSKSPNIQEDISNHLKGALSFGLPSKVGGMTFSRPYKLTKKSKNFTHIRRPGRKSSKLQNHQSGATSRKELMKRVEKKIEMDNIDHLDENLQLAYRILVSLLGDNLKSFNTIFMETIELDPSINGDYLEVVKEPIWIPKIKEKLLAKEYNSLTEVIGQIRLMFENTYRYFGASHSFSKRGLRMEYALEQKLSQLSEDKKAMCTLEATQDMLEENFGESTKMKSCCVKINGDTYFSHLMFNVRGCRPLREKELKRKKFDLMKQAKLSKEVELTHWEENLTSGSLGGPIKHMWELVQINQFLYLSMRILNITSISQYELERVLMIPESSMTLRMVMTSLTLPKQQRAKLAEKPFMPYSTWARRLASRTVYWYRMYAKESRNVKKLQDQLGIEPKFWVVCGQRSPFETNLFHEMTLYQRVWLLKTLCDYISHTHKSVQECITEQDEEKFVHMREEVLGQDRNGYEYIHFPQFSTTDVRIYKRTKWKYIDYDKIKNKSGKNNCQEKAFSQHQIKSFKKLLKKIIKNRERDEDWETEERKRQNKLPKKRGRKRGSNVTSSGQNTPGSSQETRARPQRLRQTPKPRYTLQLDDEIDDDAQLSKYCTLNKRKIVESSDESSNEEEEKSDEDDVKQQSSRKSGRRKSKDSAFDHCCETCGKKFSTKVAMYGHTATHVKKKEKTVSRKRERLTGAQGEKEETQVKEEEKEVSGSKSELEEGKPEERIKVDTEQKPDKEIKDEEDIVKEIKNEEGIEAKSKDEISEDLTEPKKEEILDDKEMNSISEQEEDAKPNTSSVDTVSLPLVVKISKSYSGFSESDKKDEIVNNEKLYESQIDNDQSKVTDNSDIQSQTTDSSDIQSQTTDNCGIQTQIIDNDQTSDKSVQNENESKLVSYSSNNNKNENVNSNDSDLPKETNDNESCNLIPQTTTTDNDTQDGPCRSHTSSDDNESLLSPAVNHDHKINLKTPDHGEFELIASSFAELRNLIQNFGSLPKKYAKEKPSLEDEKNDDDDDKDEETMETEETEQEEKEEEESNEDMTDDKQTENTDKSKPIPRCEQKLHRALCNLLIEWAPFESKMNAAQKQIKKKLWNEFLDWSKRDEAYVDPAEEAWNSDPEPEPAPPSATQTPKPSSSSSSNEDSYNDDGTRKRKLRKRKVKRVMMQETSPSPTFDVDAPSPPLSGAEDKIAVSSRGRVRKVKHIMNYDRMDFDKLALQAEKESLAQKELKRKKKGDDCNSEYSKLLEPLEDRRLESEKRLKVGKSGDERALEAAAQSLHIPSTGVKRYIISKEGEVVGYIGNDGQVHTGMLKNKEKKFVAKNSVPFKSPSDKPKLVESDKTPKVVLSAVNESGTPVYVRMVGNQALELIRIIKDAKLGPPRQIKLQRFSQTYTFSTDSDVLTQNIPGYPDSDTSNPLLQAQPPVSSNEPKSPIPNKSTLSPMKPSQPSLSPMKPQPSLSPMKPQPSLSPMKPQPSLSPMKPSQPSLSHMKPSPKLSTKENIPSLAAVAQPVSQPTLNLPSSSHQETEDNLQSISSTVTSLVGIQPNTSCASLSASTRLVYASQSTVPSVSPMTAPKPPISTPNASNITPFVIQTENGQQIQIGLNDRLTQIIQKTGQRIVAVPNDKGGYTISLISATNSQNQGTNVSTSGVAVNNQLVAGVAPGSAVSRVLPAGVSVTGQRQTVNIVRTQTVAQPSSSQNQPQIATNYSTSPQVMNVSTPVGRQILIRHPVGGANSASMLTKLLTQPNQQAVQFAQSPATQPVQNSIPQQVLQISQQGGQKVVQIVPSNTAGRQMVQMVQPGQIFMSGNNPVTLVRPANTNQTPKIIHVAQPQPYIAQPSQPQQIVYQNEQIQPVPIQQQQAPPLQSYSVQQSNPTIQPQTNTNVSQIPTTYFSNEINQPAEQSSNPSHLSEMNQELQQSPTLQQSKDTAQMQPKLVQTKPQVGRLLLVQTNEGQKVCVQLPDGKLSVLSAEQLQPLIASGAIKVNS